jgi:SHS2 domain-containing protein
MDELKIIESGAFGDYEFEALAETREKLFEICAIATFEAMTNVSEVKPLREIEFEVSGEDEQELLYAFLAELIYIKDVEKIFLCRYDIKFGEGFKLECKARGEHIDSAKHELKTDVKAVTYHKFAIEKIDDGYRAHVILDL